MLTYQVDPAGDTHQELGPLAELGGKVYLQLIRPGRQSGWQLGPLSQQVSHAWRQCSLIDSV
jgi:hypothetical protein